MSNWPLLGDGQPRRSITFVDANVIYRQVSRAATPHARGPWAELIAATPFTAAGFTVALSLDPNWAPTRYMLDLALGAAGSEVPLIESLPGNMAAGYRGEHLIYTLPLRIPAGSRVSAAMRVSDVNISATRDCDMSLFPSGPRVAEGFAGADVFGANTAATDSSIALPISYGGAAITEVVASTARTYRGVMVSHMTVVPGYYDVLVGPAGSEGELVWKQSLAGGFGGSPITGMSLVAPVHIPAGSRVSLRATYCCSPTTTFPIVHLLY